MITMVTTTGLLITMVLITTSTGLLITTTTIITTTVTTTMVTTTGLITMVTTTMVTTTGLITTIITTTMITTTTMTTTTLQLLLSEVSSFGHECVALPDSRQLSARFFGECASQSLLARWYRWCWPPRFSFVAGETVDF